MRKKDFMKLTYIGIWIYQSVITVQYNDQCDTLLRKKVWKNILLRYLKFTLQMCPCLSCGLQYMHYMCIHSKWVSNSIFNHCLTVIFYLSFVSESPVKLFKMCLPRSYSLEIIIDWIGFGWEQGILKKLKTQKIMPMCS